MVRDLEKHRIVSAIVQITHGATNPLSIWGPYFSDTQKQHEDNLLSQAAFAIYFCTLYDVFDAGTRRLPILKNEARAGGYKGIAISCHTLGKQLAFSGDILSKVPLTVQMCVRYYRDQWVHGPLGNYFRESDIRVKLVEDLEFVPTDQCVLDFHDFHKTVEKISAEYNGPAGVLSKAAEAISTHQDWLKQIEHLNCPPDELYRSLMQDSVISPNA